MSEAGMDEELLEELYGWVDQIPLSRPKRDIRRDFSDGVLVAEVVRHFLPRVVELHNYTPANKRDGKITNWKLLNRKVFKRLGFELADDVIDNVADCKPWAVEQVMTLVRRKIDRHLYEQNHSKQSPRTTVGSVSDRPEADQGMKAYEPTVPQKPGSKASPMKKAPSNQNLNMAGLKNAASGKYKVEMVPKIEVEEKEQEILTKDETIQILNAKVRRLEHLLHLKDIRIDDLQGRLERLELQLKPTAKPKQVKR